MSGAPNKTYVVFSQKESDTYWAYFKILLDACGRLARANKLEKKIEENSMTPVALDVFRVEFNGDRRNLHESILKRKEEYCVAFDHFFETCQRLHVTCWQKEDSERVLIDLINDDRRDYHRDIMLQYKKQGVIIPPLSSE